MLTCHKNIVVPPECGFVVWWYSKYGNWEQRQKDSDARKLAFVKDLMRSRKIETWDLDEDDLIKLLRDRNPASYAELVSCVYEIFGISRGRRANRWGDKNNFYVNHVMTLKAIFEDAKFVHLIRDGRDVVCSYKELNERQIDSPYAPSLPSEIGKIAREWAGNIRKATQAFDQFGWENVIEIRFEDLVLSSERVLRELCDGLGEEFDSRMLEYFIHNKEEKLEPIEFLKWKHKTLRKLDGNVVRRHTRELSHQEIESIEEIVGDILADYRYL